ncbi:MAG: dihydropteroate synthase [Coriobacteriales bacterium]|jgi:5-methyltetrahydrofolate--homocysteine methyltransferase|nr:dihydropteroate synthase [Coriobacteriales bacterium]
MIIIGEKINGFIPKTLKAIEARDGDYIKEIALAQQECGADFIDICAGVAPEVEMETMEWLIGLVQEVCTVPISLDSSDPQIIVNCIPLCSQPGLINSVSMEEGKTGTVFPVIADTDWKVVCLTCNQEGIPDDGQTKFAIARDIVACARSYGIADDRVYIDPLVTTLGTKSDSMVSFVEAIELIRAEFPEVHITSGLSNISYGLPYRRGINMQFLCLTMNAGMDSAILDPMDPYMQSVLYATNALKGNDPYCMEYLGAYRDGLLPVKPE